MGTSENYTHTHLAPPRGCKKSGKEEVKEPKKDGLLSALE